MTKVTRSKERHVGLKVNHTKKTNFLKEIVKNNIYARLLYKKKLNGIFHEIKR